MAATTSEPDRAVGNGEDGDSVFVSLDDDDGDDYRPLLLPGVREKPRRYPTRQYFRSVLRWKFSKPAHIILHTHTHTHTHPFNGPLSGTTRVRRYQKAKPVWI